MQPYTVYLLSTGKIQGTGYSKDPASEIDSTTGYILGIYSPEEYQIENGVAVTLVLTSAEQDKIFLKTRNHYKYLVNLDVGIARKKYITDIPGQENVYKQKESEALAYIANPNIAASSIPHISKEVGITAPDLASVAAVILGLADFFVAKSADIEELRITTISLIESATTVSELDTILENFYTNLSTM